MNAIVGRAKRKEGTISRIMPHNIAPMKTSSFARTAGPSTTIKRHANLHQSSRTAL